ncbi:MAG: carboxypeptidase regulatory-like domain-containing protein, partial [Pyrinomonadaceae bacterium]|nr:carboxypeptidase regulatory-like domain-containing protein [Pyrinomonadaceae bacterium]
NTVAVGATLDDIGTGAANVDKGSTYIFVRSGTNWTQQANLSDPNGVSQSNFGCSLALNGENLVVGANGFQGFAYLFVRSGTNWTLQTKFQSDDINTNDSFGSSVGINGDLIVVGAKLANIGTIVDQGAVYVFQRIAITGNLLQTQKITATGGAQNDNFGTSLGFDGNSIIVGANLDDVGTKVDQGSVYVFVRDMAMMWTQQVQLFNGNGLSGDNFGNSVAISGNIGIGGAVFDDVDGRTDQGSAQGLFRNNNNTWAQPAVLVTTDDAMNDAFGYSTAIDGTTAVVGAAFEDIGANTDQGAIYVYTKSGNSWNRQAKLVDAEGKFGDALGYRVAISGDTIVAGAFSSDGVNQDQGAVYVFVRNGTNWTLQAKLFANDGATNDFLGSSVAIFGDTIVSGAISANINGNIRQGAAYVFKRTGTNWTQQAKLVSDDGLNDDNFGWSVATDGTSAIIGVIGDDTDGRDGQGSAYVFNNNGVWTQTQKLTMNDPQPATAFGASIAIDNDSLVVGAFFSNVGNVSTQGAAYVFRRNSGIWTQEAKLVSSDGGDNDNFGFTVDIDENNIIIGSTYSDINSNINQGSIYTYERTGTSWTQIQKLTPNDGAAFDTFGFSVSIDGSNIVVGSPDADVINQNSLKTQENLDNAIAANADQGAVYFYSNAAPTAASAILGGRVFTAQGRPIKNVRVALTGGNLSETRYANSNAFGFYRFENLPTGNSYVISARGKRFTFSEPTQIVNLTEDQNAVDFIGLR